MPLTVKHNRADHTHENEQFRRIAISLRLLFEDKGWSGLLIGNPFNENYSRFRPDGLLLYDQGLIIIDLKAYSGRIKLPPNKTEFESVSWYTESEADKKRTLIKAGNRFINPFKQLDSYRKVFKEIVDNELRLKNEINRDRTCALNIFSGPMEIQNSIPKEIPYYKISQESDLGTVLYDYSSENKYSSKLADSLCAVFNAEDWEEHIKMPDIPVLSEQVIEIDSNVESAISEFINSKDSGVLILESMELKERDNWVEFVLSRSVEYEISQTETWIHSTRIGRRVSNRMGIELQSLYNTIYGGSSKSANDNETEEEIEQSEEHLQEVVQIRSDDSIDESALIILHEAHLVSRSLHQSELLKFGTGRLLEDLYKFLNLKETKRKLICIGDPYSLTYGKDSDSALNTETIKELFDGEIHHYRKRLPTTKPNGKLGLRVKLASGIEDQKFNNLSYDWSEENLERIDKDSISNYLNSWFSEPLSSEPSNTVLVYENSDARKINSWVKKHCLKNGEEVAENDLLLLYNNVKIADETGFGHPTRLYNGMFLLIKSIGEKIRKQIHIRQSKEPIVLNFTELKCICLSLPNNPITNLYSLDNFFDSANGLSKEEQIAFRVLVNQLVQSAIKDDPFEKSDEYTQLLEDIEYKRAMLDLKKLNEDYKSGLKVKTKLDAQSRIVRKIERSYQRIFRNKVLRNIIQTDPFINAIHAHYGWAFTVHKSVGSSFSKVILNAYQGENRGVSNADYFRWLYSGATTSLSSLLVVNPQELHPMIDVRFEDISSQNSGKTQSDKKSIKFNSYEVDHRFSSIVSTIQNENVKGAICELSKSIEKSGYLLESVSVNNDYLSKAIYSSSEKGENSLIIAINNKGQKDQWVVSSIRIEKIKNDNSDVINGAILDLFNDRSDSQQSRIIEFPEDFRNSVYRRWKTDLERQGFILSLIEAHEYQDNFEIRSKPEAYAKIRVWYGADGFFRKIELLEKSDSHLGDDIKKWLLNGSKA